MSTGRGEDKNKKKPLLLALSPTPSIHNSFVVSEAQGTTNAAAGIIVHPFKLSWPAKVFAWAERKCFLEVLFIYFA